MLANMGGRGSREHTSTREMSGPSSQAGDFNRGKVAVRVAIPPSRTRRYAVQNGVAALTCGEESGIEMEFEIGGRAAHALDRHLLTAVGGSV